MTAAAPPRPPGSTPPPALDAPRFSFDGLVVYAAGPDEPPAAGAAAAPPLLLVHSVNAAASAAEVRPIFEHARRSRRVFALDLPGFGLSDRSDRRYTPRVMTDAVLATIAQIRRRLAAGEGGGGGTATGAHDAVPAPGPVDLLAVSLGCEFAARAAAEQPALVRRLALVSPTGFNGSTPRRAVPGTTREVPGLRAALAVPLWSGTLFAGLTRPGVVRFFLEKTWGSKAIDEAMWAQAVAQARAPGARHAPLAFLSGGLFSADIHAVYEALGMPVWMSHGTRGDFTDYRGKALVEGRPNWRFSVYEAGALPYFEHPGRFMAELDDFLGGPGVADSRTA